MSYLRHLGCAATGLIFASLSSAASAACDSRLVGQWLVQGRSVALDTAIDTPTFIVTIYSVSTNGKVVPAAYMRGEKYKFPTVSWKCEGLSFIKLEKGKPAGVKQEGIRLSDTKLVLKETLSGKMAETARSIGDSTESYLYLDKVSEEEANAAIHKELPF